MFAVALRTGLVVFIAVAIFRGMKRQFDWDPRVISAPAPGSRKQLGAAEPQPKNKALDRTNRIKK